MVSRWTPGLELVHHPGANVWMPEIETPARGRGSGLWRFPALDRLRD